MPTILKVKWFGWCWLWGFWGVEGLDKKTGVRDQGTGVSKSKGKCPGLKPLDSTRLVQGAEAPCSLRKGKDENPTHRKERDGWGSRFVDTRRCGATGS